jgi:hypothetical protein
MEQDELVIDGIKFTFRSRSALGSGQKYEAVIRYLVNAFVRVPLPQKIEVAEMYASVSIKEIQMFLPPSASRSESPGG